MEGNVFEELSIPSNYQDLVTCYKRIKKIEYDLWCEQSEVDLENYQRIFIEELDIYASSDTKTEKNYIVLTIGTMILYCFCPKKENERKNFFKVIDFTKTNFVNRFIAKYIVKQCKTCESEYIDVVLELFNKYYKDDIKIAQLIFDCIKKYAKKALKEKSCAFCSHFTSLIFEDNRALQIIAAKNLHEVFALKTTEIDSHEAFKSAMENNNILSKLLFLRELVDHGDKEFSNNVDDFIKLCEENFSNEDKDIEIAAKQFYISLIPLLKDRREFEDKASHIDFFSDPHMLSHILDVDYKLLEDKIPIVVSTLRNNFDEDLMRKFHDKFYHLFDKFEEDNQQFIEEILEILLLHPMTDDFAIDIFLDTERELLNEALLKQEPELRAKIISKMHYAEFADEFLESQDYRLRKLGICSIEDPVRLVKILQFEKEPKLRQKILKIVCKEFKTNEKEQSEIELSNEQICEIIPIIRACLNDESVQVQKLAIDLMPKLKCEDCLKPLIMSVHSFLFKDKSLKVHARVTSILPNLFRSVKQEAFKLFIPLFRSLIFEWFQNKHELETLFDKRFAGIKSINFIETIGVIADRDINTLSGHLNPIFQILLTYDDENKLSYVLKTIYNIIKKIGPTKSQEIPLLYDKLLMIGKHVNSYKIHTLLFKILGEIGIIPPENQQLEVPIRKQPHKISVYQLERTSQSYYTLYVFEAVFDYLFKEILAGNNYHWIMIRIIYENKAYISRPIVEKRIKKYMKYYLELPDEIFVENLSDIFHLPSQIFLETKSQFIIRIEQLMNREKYKKTLVSLIPYSIETFELQRTSKTLDIFTSCCASIMSYNCSIEVISSAEKLCSYTKFQGHNFEYLFSSLINALLSPSLLITQQVHVLNTIYFIIVSIGKIDLNLQSTVKHIINLLPKIIRACFTLLDYSRRKNDEFTDKINNEMKRASSAQNVQDIIKRPQRRISNPLPEAADATKITNIVGETEKLIKNIFCFFSTKEYFDHYYQYTLQELRKYHFDIKEIEEKYETRLFNKNVVPRDYKIQMAPRKIFPDFNGDSMVTNFKLGDDFTEDAMSNWYDRIVSFCVKHSRTKTITYCDDIYDNDAGFKKELFKISFYSCYKSLNSSQKSIIDGNLCKSLKTNIMSVKIPIIELIEFMDRSRADMKFNKIINTSVLVNAEQLSHALRNAIKNYDGTKQSSQDLARLYSLVGMTDETKALGNDLSNWEEIQTPTKSTLFDIRKDNNRLINAMELAKTENIYYEFFKNPVFPESMLFKMAYEINAISHEHFFDQLFKDRQKFHNLLFTSKAIDSVSYIQILIDSKAIEAPVLFNIFIEQENVARVVTTHRCFVDLLKSYYMENEGEFTGIFANFNDILMITNDKEREYAINNCYKAAARSMSQEQPSPPPSRTGSDETHSTPHLDTGRKGSLTEMPEIIDIPKLPTRKRRKAHKSESLLTEPAEKSRIVKPQSVIYCSENKSSHPEKIEPKQPKTLLDFIPGLKTYISDHVTIEQILILTEFVDLVDLFRALTKGECIVTLDKFYNYLFKSEKINKARLLEHILGELDQQAMMDVYKYFIDENFIDVTKLFNHLLNDADVDKTKILEILIDKKLIDKRILMTKLFDNATEQEKIDGSLRFANNFCEIGDWDYFDQAISFCTDKIRGTILKGIRAIKLASNDSKKERKAISLFKTHSLSDGPIFDLARTKPDFTHTVKINMDDSIEEIVEKGFQILAQQGGTYFSQSFSSLAPFILFAQQLNELLETDLNSSKKCIDRLSKCDESLFNNIRSLLIMRNWYIKDTESEKHHFLRRARKANEWDVFIRFFNKYCKCSDTKRNNNNLLVMSEFAHYLWCNGKRRDAINMLNLLKYKDYRIRTIISKFKLSNIKGGNSYRVFEAITKNTEEGLKYDYFQAHFVWAWANQRMITLSAQKQTNDFNDLNQKNPIQDFAINAVHSFAFCVNASRDSNFAFVLQLSTLLFHKCSTLIDVYKSNKELLNAIPITSFIQIVPQLLYFQQNVYQSNNTELIEFLKNILSSLLKEFPNSVVFSYLFSDELNKNRAHMRSMIGEVLNEYKDDDGVLKDALQIKSVFGKVCQILQEYEYQALVDFKEFRGNEEDFRKNAPRFTNHIKNILERINKEESELDEQYKAEPNIHNDVVQFFKKCLINANDTGTKLNEEYVKSRESVETVLRLAGKLKILEKTKGRPISFSIFDKEFVMKNKWAVTVFGSSQPGKEQIYIDHFDNTITVIKSLKRPRKISLVGTDGKNYRFLLKMQEDIRTDERVMQFFKLINTILPSSMSKIKTYAIFPMTPSFGIIQWISKSLELKEIISIYRGENKKFPNELKVITDQLPGGQIGFYNNLQNIQKLELHTRCIEETKMNRNHIRDAIWEMTPDSESWLKFTKNFIRTNALMSVAGYIIGLGDRHLGNIMLEKRTGNVFHIDYGDTFEKSLERKVHPEKVPFRCTRMMQAAFGPCGVNGSFKRIIEDTIIRIRDNQESILSVLDIFLQQPVEKGNITSLKRTVSQSIEIRPEVMRIEARIKQKIDGLDFNNQRPLTPTEQAEMLIKQATDNYNIASHYSGWQAYL